jgi:lipopolysaccharide biosynthesis protein
LNREGSSSTRRLCIFSFFDPDGVADDYILYLLAELRRHVEKILFYANGSLADSSREALRGLVSDIVVRPNTGFDVLAYKAGLQRIDFDANVAYDEVLLVNHTCYGPIYPFAELFTEMERRTCDFWGVTAHRAMTPNPFTGTGRLPYHLNANFIAVRSHMLHSEPFRAYWDAIVGGANYEQAILEHEARFTDHFVQLGYTCETYLDGNKYDTHYPALLEVDQTLADRNPLMKRRALFNDPRYLEQHATNVPRALDIIRKTSHYDGSMIWRNAVRSAEWRYLNTNAALTRIFPDERLSASGSNSEIGRVALCIHVDDIGKLEEILTLSDAMPCHYDLIATTDTAAKKTIIETAAVGRNRIDSVVVRVMERTPGGHTAALLVTCRDLFLDDRYALVCRLHTASIADVGAEQSREFRRHALENLLNSSGYTANVLDMFRANPWVGVAAPPVAQISTATLGHAWGTMRPRVIELAQTLDLRVRLDTETPIGTLGGMYWFRPIALRKLFAHPWQWSDFESEGCGAFELLIAYVAQDARYVAHQILCTHQAERNFAMLEYKLQKLSSLLPDSNFTSQARFLEALAHANYRIDDVAHRDRPAIPLGRAITDLAHAMRSTLTRKFPRLARLLRRFFRSARRLRHNPPQ